MPYIPNTDEDRRIMLEKIGVKDIENLLSPVPEKLRFKGSLSLPGAMSEMELLREIETISRRNRSDLINFCGGGIYDHFIPSAVAAIAGRPEFVTAYTPYQAEVSQGTLQVIYEFQTHICRLTGMDAANASMYDGASAMAEAANMSMGKTRRSKVIVSDTVNPLFRNVMKTYLSGREIDICTLSCCDGKTDFNKLQDAIDESTSCVILAQPNFFGLIEDIETAADLIHEVGGHLIVVMDPISTALMKSPGECGADIAVGEGQPLGIPLNFGGPLFGFFAGKMDLIRLMPGRIVGRTNDVDGRTGFVLTLQTREQHIRRERATSNICTNQALCATMATIYMSLMGKRGLKQVALLCMDKAHRTAEKILALDGFEPRFSGDYIREFAVKTPLAAGEVIDRLIEENSILPGINLGRFYGGMDDSLLIAVTEKRTETEIELFINALREL